MNLFLLRLLAVLLLAVCACLSVFAQNQETPPPHDAQPSASPAQPQRNPDTPQPDTTPAKAQFFAGTVTKLDPKYIIVSRTLVGKAPESRTFLIQSKTKMGRSVRLKQRVTVRYERLPEGDVALEVQIRQRAPRTS